MRRSTSVAVLALVLIGFAVAPSTMTFIASAGSNDEPTLIVYLDGSPTERGIAYGRAAGEAIGANIASFWEDVVIVIFIPLTESTLS